MANVWNGMIHTRIAQRGLQLVSRKLAALRAFTTDFSPDAWDGGQVTTRLFGRTTAIDVEDNYGALVADETPTEVPIPMNVHKGRGFHINDREATMIARGVWSDSVLRLIASRINAVSFAVIGDVMSIITAANFPSEEVLPPGLFNSDDLIDLRTKASNADWDDDRAFVGSPDYTGGLLKDLNQNPAFSQDARAGAIGAYAGFDLFESPHIPHNTENLASFTCTPDCLAVAMRYVPPQVPADMIHAEALQDPATGVVIGYRAWYDRNLGRVLHTFDCLWGKAKGNPESLHRLKSA